MTNKAKLKQLAVDFGAQLATNDAEWDGNGLPPVGTKCEVMFTLDTTPRWYQCNIDYSCQDVGVLDIEGKKCAFTTRPSNGHSVVFRKIETPEQKAEREKREEAEEMIQCLFDNYAECEDSAIDYVIDYLKECEVLGK